VPLEGLFGESRTRGAAARQDNADNIGIYDRAAVRPKFASGITGPISERCLRTGRPSHLLPRFSPLRTPHQASRSAPRRPGQSATITLLYHGTWNMNGALSIGLERRCVNMARGRENPTSAKASNDTADAEQACGIGRRKGRAHGFPAAVSKITIKVEDPGPPNGLHFTTQTWTSRSLVVGSCAGTYFRVTGSDSPKGRSSAQPADD
jgi:hypothetical protein